jgi:xylan 1,4-beta-xylosidase
MREAVPVQIMKLRCYPFLLMFTSLGFTLLSAQPANPVAASAAPLSVSQPGTYSGISGPGAPVQGNGLGGWRSGKDGVRYKGPNPKPGWQLDWDEKQTSSDLVISLGLLPPIKPIWELHLRDTIICLGGDGNYYMTGSSGDNIWDKNDGVELWRSTDLKKWDYLGLVWSLTKDATWQKGASYVWAPEIHYLKSKNTYCLTLSVGGRVTGTGLLISTSGKPEGPYVNPFKPDQRATGGIDPTVFEDDDGKIYYTWGHGSTIYQLKNDLSGFTDQGHNISLDDASRQAARAIGVNSGVGNEGVSLFKRNGKYYLGAADFIGGVDRRTGRNGRYSSCVAISDNIYGPYTLYEEAVPCGAGGNYFQDKDGNWYCTYFGNDEASPFREKPGLVRIDFKSNGQIKIADEQPAFILRDGAPTLWRSQLTKPSLPPTPATESPAKGTLSPTP